MIVQDPLSNMNLGYAHGCAVSIELPYLQTKHTRVLATFSACQQSDDWFHARKNVLGHRPEALNLKIPLTQRRTDWTRTFELALLLSRKWPPSHGFCPWIGVFGILGHDERIIFYALSTSRMIAGCHSNVSEGFFKTGLPRSFWIWAVQSKSRVSERTSRWSVEMKKAAVATWLWSHGKVRVS